MNRGPQRREAWASLPCDGQNILLTFFSLKRAGLRCCPRASTSFFRIHIVGNRRTPAIPWARESAGNKSIRPRREPLSAIASENWPPSLECQVTRQKSTAFLGSGEADQLARRKLDGYTRLQQQHSRRDQNRDRSRTPQLSSPGSGGGAKRT